MIIAKNSIKNNLTFKFAHSFMKILHIIYKINTPL